MPTKVRCPGCKKVLNAPDTARGKAVRCPQCQTKVPVPAGRHKRPVPTAAPDSSSFLADLNLREAEDSNYRVCPRCGTEARLDAINCSECGVDLQTGQLSEGEVKRRQMKGPDPAGYYKQAWTDPREFIKQNKQIVFRTLTYMIVLAVLASGCLFMAGWSEKLPPKIFWLGLAISMCLSYIGWLWFLTTEIINTTLKKKKHKLNRIHFDFFLNIALGVKTLLWSVVFGLPAILVGGGLFHFVDPLVGGAAAGLLAASTYVMFPISMAHMSMPLTWKAWVPPMMLKILLNNFVQTVYCCVVGVVTSLVCFAAPGISLIVFWNDVVSMVGLLNDALSGGIVEASHVPWLALIPAFFFIVSLVIFPYVAIFNMRSFGLFAYYNKRTLDLVTRISERTRRKIEMVGDMLPHRADRLLTMARWGVIFFPLAIKAYFDSSADLDKMDLLKMDPSGYDKTEKAAKLAYVVSFLSTLTFVGGVAVYAAYYLHREEFF